jgi:hypothetical protein
MNYQSVFCGGTNTYTVGLDSEEAIIKKLKPLIYLGLSFLLEVDF